MSQDQLISLVALGLALILAVMRLRGELAARRHLNDRQQQNQQNQPPAASSDDVERFR
jgi:hypothetical protein